jgi:hypothetical protein
VPVDRPVLVAFAEQPLSLSGHARYGPAAQLSNREPGTVESVVAPVKGRLSHASVFVEHQWVQVSPASSRRDQF